MEKYSAFLFKYSPFSCLLVPETNISINHELGMSKFFISIDHRIGSDLSLCNKSRAFFGSRDLVVLQFFEAGSCSVAH